MIPQSESGASKPLRDDGLEWLREIRRQLSAECNHDPSEMGRRLRELQKEHPERIYRTKRVLVRVNDGSESTKASAPSSAVEPL